MRLPPWYRPRSRPLAEALLTLDFARTTGIGPLEPTLSAMWDMTPICGAVDSSHRVRLIVDWRGETLSVKRQRTLLATISLRRDPKRIGEPLRAVCPGCGPPGAPPLPRPGCVACVASLRQVPARDLRLRAGQ